MAEIDILKEAKRVIEIESKEVLSQSKYLDKEFVEVVKMLSNLKGKLIVVGVGKSGLIGRKIAATFSSIGTPAIFAYPTEILHGELGLISPEDIVLFVSYSGETEEIKRILPLIKQRGIRTVAMTSKQSSSLGRICESVIKVQVKREACPHDIVPTSSTTSLLALGDALAVCVSKIKGLKKNDYLKYHPGGTIGKKLSIKVKRIMRTGKDNPVVKMDSTVKDALIVMTRTKLGATSVIDKNGKLVGYFTDGDLRRGLQRFSDFLKMRISDVMTKKPTVIDPDVSAFDAAKLMQDKKCDNLPVVDRRKKPIGIVDERDLIAIGIL